jgi:hypothetical protein
MRRIDIRIMRFFFIFGATVAFMINSFVSLVAANKEAALDNSSADDNKLADAEFHGPPPRPGYPDPFELGYVLFETLSPNKQYGVIYPNRLLLESPDFVVDLKKSQILASLDSDEPYFEGKNHGGLSVNWSPDSRAALIENQGKWSPINLTLVELKDGRVVRQTQLLDQHGKMFSPAIAKAERTHPKEAEVATLGITSVKWKAGKNLQLEIKCEGGTNPKGFTEQSSWNGELTSIWDVGQRKFVAHRIAHTSFRPAGREEE